MSFMRLASRAIAVLFICSGMLAVPFLDISPGGFVEIPVSANAVPDHIASDGYGFDPLTATMTDHNGFEYSYRPDGVIQLTLPWGYTTYFSFGMTATYLGSPAIRTALDYSWSWATDSEEFTNTWEKEIYVPPVYDPETNTTTPGYYANETVTDLIGYDYTFTASNLDGVLDWTIIFEFFHDAPMKITHIMQNEFANPLIDAEFWYLFDLRDTPSPYVVETSAGIVTGPLYQEIPDGIHWVRLSNEFQFDWRDALIEYENGHAYVGDGSVIGLDGLPILGISLDLGDLAPGAVVTIDPYFSGVTKTWDAGAAGYAGDAANWDPVGHPLVGDNVTFDGTSVYNCNWNLSVTLGTFSVLTGYSGTITLSVSMSTNDVVFNSGSLGGGAYLWTCSGNWTIGSGYTSGTPNVMMTGDATYIQNSKSQYEFYKLTIDANVSYLITNSIYTQRLDVNQYCTFTLGTTFQYRAGISGQNEFVNDGDIAGAGTLLIYYTSTSSVSQSFVFGAISVDVQFNCLSSITASRTFLLGADTVISGNVNLVSGHATYTATLSMNGYSFECEGFTLSTRGILSQGAGTFTVKNYAQSGAGSVFTGNANAWVICSENYTVSQGLVTKDVTRIEMTGSNKIITSTDQEYHTLKFTQSATVTPTGSYILTDRLLIETGKTLTLSASTKIFGVTVATSPSFQLENNGTIAGPGKFYLDMYAPYSTDFGIITAPTYIVNNAASTVSTTLSLNSDTEIQNALYVQSGHATYITTLNQNGFELEATSIIIGTRGIIDSDNSTITVGTSWTSTSGTFEHDSNTVIFEGTGTLAMATTDSFYNVTIGAGATVTMNTDTYVDCRATILGTMAGTGDFIEPEPEFTTSYLDDAYYHEWYEYEISQLYWDDLALVDGPDWLSLIGTTLIGVPGETDTGVVEVSLSLTWNDMVTYQNWTLYVGYPVISESTNTVLGIVIAMVLGFGLIAVGGLVKEPIFYLLSGIVWIFAAIPVYLEINIGWAIISISVGMSALVLGSLRYAGEKN